MRGDCTQRRIRLARLLEESRTGYSFYELASRFGVTTRTIRRDLDTLRACGAEIAQQGDRDLGTKVYVGPLRWQ